MILVDALFDWPGPRGYRRWCHMTSDTGVGELHAMADRIGLKRSWFQSKDRPNYLLHYDLTPSKRALAVAAGAVEVDSIELVKRGIRRGAMTQ